MNNLGKSLFLSKPNRSISRRASIRSATSCHVILQHEENSQADQHYEFKRRNTVDCGQQMNQGDEYDFQSDSSEGGDAFEDVHLTKDIEIGGLMAPASSTSTSTLLGYLLEISNCTDDDEDNEEE